MDVSTLPCRPESLTFMVGAAFRRNFTIGFAQQRIVVANIERQLAGGLRIGASPKIGRVPKYPFRLPHGYLGQLFREAVGVASGFKSLNSQYGRGLMMTMTSSFVWGEASYDDVGPK